MFVEVLRLDLKRIYGRSRGGSVVVAVGHDEVDQGKRKGI